VAPIPPKPGVQFAVSQPLPKPSKTFLTGKRKRDGSPLGGTHEAGLSRRVPAVPLPHCKGKKLSQIQRTDLKAIHKKTTAKSPAQADRAIAVVSSVFTYMIDQEVFSGPNPASRVQKNPSTDRDRFAQGHELPHLLDAVARSGQSDYFLLSLLTGARRSNVQAMAWRDLDLPGAVWRIGNTKNGTPQNVPLSPEAVMVLKARQEYASTSPFVFPGTGKTGHLVEPKRAWSTILRTASLLSLLEALKLDDAARQEANTLLEQGLSHAEERYHAEALSAQINPADFAMTDLRIHDLRRTLGELAGEDRRLAGDHRQEPEPQDPPGHRDLCAPRPRSGAPVGEHRHRSDAGGGRPEGRCRRACRSGRSAAARDTTLNDVTPCYTLSNDQELRAQGASSLL
jgi:integrase